MRQNFSVRYFSWLVRVEAWLHNRQIDLQGFLNCLNRSPMPKLGDLLPKVPGKWCVKSDGVAPDIDLKRDPLEKEYFYFVGEKLTLS